ncbi:MAG: cysteine-rich repeat protein [Myxococcota bacterium]|jgi:cysteine-rich repeat protein
MHTLRNALAGLATIVVLTPGATFACVDLPGECICGDSWIIEGEECDDGNLDNDDGCSSTCALEPGWRCSGEAPGPDAANPGGLCVRLCGDAVLDAGETCDDGNVTTGDGCDIACAIEPGYSCPTVGELCIIVCGNGQLDGDEACDGGASCRADCTCAGSNIPDDALGCMSCVPYDKNQHEDPASIINTLRSGIGSGISEFYTDPYGGGVFPWFQPDGIDSLKRLGGLVATLVTDVASERRAMLSGRWWYYNSCAHQEDDLPMDATRDVIYDVMVGERFRHTRFNLPRFPELVVQLKQEACGSRMTQTYTVASSAAEALDLRFTRGMDLDLQVAGHGGQNTVGEYPPGTAAAATGITMFDADPTYLTTTTSGVGSDAVFEGWRGYWGGFGSTVAAKMWGSDGFDTTPYPGVDGQGINGIWRPSTGHHTVVDGCLFQFSRESWCQISTDDVPYAPSGPSPRGDIGGGVQWLLSVPGGGEADLVIETFSEPGNAGCCSADGIDDLVDSFTATPEAIARLKDAAAEVVCPASPWVLDPDYKSWCSDTGADQDLSPAERAALQDEMACVCGVPCAVCGDGQLDPGESCDDGNDIDDDECTRACLLPEPPDGCGNGNLEVALGEACDDGDVQSGNGCDRNCQLEEGWTCSQPSFACERICSNGQLDAGETCDDGNLAPDDGCDATCQMAPGYSCPTVGELCIIVCGNGQLDGDEDCDGGASCRADCTCAGSNIPDDALGCKSCVPYDNRSHEDPLAVRQTLESGSGPGNAQFFLDPYGSGLFPWFHPDGFAETTRFGGWVSTLVSDMASERRAMMAGRWSYFNSCPHQEEDLPMDVTRDVIYDVTVGQRFRYTRFLVPRFPELVVDLKQEACGSHMTQTYAFTSTGNEALDLRITRGMDLDLYADGGAGQNTVGEYPPVEAGAATGINFYDLNPANRTTTTTGVGGDAVFEGWRGYWPGFGSTVGAKMWGSNGFDATPYPGVDGDGLNGIWRPNTGHHTVVDGCVVQFSRPNWCQVDAATDLPVSATGPSQAGDVGGAVQWRLDVPAGDTASLVVETFAEPGNAGCCSADGIDDLVDSFTATPEAIARLKDAAAEVVCPASPWVLDPDYKSWCSDTGADQDLSPAERAALQDEMACVCGVPCAVCGDGQLDPGESCDDGNDIDDDECTRTCRQSDPPPGCGNGNLDEGEACDDGDLQGGNGCSRTCQLEDGWTCPQPGSACRTLCGDGIVAGTEACDDGGNISGDGCSPTCVLETSLPCGNASLDVNEQCDDGNLTTGDGCSGTCQLEPGFDCSAPGVVCQAVCGDGVFVFPEHCDDGNLERTDGCSETCQVEAGWVCPSGIGCHPFCGDGVVVGDEPCDDGNPTPFDGCSDRCAIEPGFDCSIPGAACVYADVADAQDDHVSTYQDVAINVVVVQNDRGPDIRVTEVTDGPEGTAERLDDFTVRYFPATGMTGEATFSYLIVDSAGIEDSATVHVTVEPLDAASFRVVQAAQSCGPDGKSTQLDVIVVGGSGSYDLDGSQVPPSFRIVESLGHGATHVVGDLSGVDVLQDLIMNGTLDCTPPPKPLTARDDAATAIGGVATVDVLENDTGAGLEVILVGRTRNGQVTITGPELRFAASGSFVGDEVLSYTVRDATGATDQATVTFTVQPLGRIDARDDSATVAAGEGVCIDVVANDIGPITLASVSRPGHGIATLQPQGCSGVWFAAHADYTGEDSFTYTVSSTSGSDTATVNVFVSGGGVCARIEVSEAETSCAFDGDTFTVAFDIRGGSGGYLVNGQHSRGGFVSTSHAVGTIARFAVADVASADTCLQQRLSVSTDCAEGPALRAIDDSYRTKAATPLLVHPVANDEGVGLTVGRVGLPEHGELGPLGLGVFIYTPDTAFVGEDRFTYTVRDDQGGTDSGAVTIAVAAHDPQVCNTFGAEDTVSSCQDGAQTYTVSAKIVGGSGVYAADLGSIRRGLYRSPAIASGEPLSVAITDRGQPLCRPFTLVAQHVCESQSDGPRAEPDVVIAEPGSFPAFNPLDNDVGEGVFVSERPGPPIDEATGEPAGGIISSLEPWVFAPRPGYEGVATATYRVEDANGASAEGKIVIFIIPREDRVAGCQRCPIAAADDRIVTRVGDTATYDLTRNDLGGDLEVVAFRGAIGGQVEVEGNTLHWSPTEEVEAHRMQYTIRDRHGLTATAKVLLSATSSVSCEADAGALQMGPPIGCGYQAHSAGYEQGRGYAQAMVVTDTFGVVVAVQAGPTLLAPLSPGAYRVYGLNYRFAAAGSLPEVGGLLVLTHSCAALSEPFQYTELTPMEITLSPTCDAEQNVELGVGLSGGRPEFGVGGYTLRLEPLPPYRPGQLVIVSASDGDTGSGDCGATRILTVPTDICQEVGR